MNNKYKTALGKMIDIDNLRLKNENAIAVGNMKVNAKGDSLGQGGKVIQTRNQNMDAVYGKVRSQPAIEIENVAPDGESFDPVEDLANEQIQPLEPKLRGSLADSIAKKTTVTQETMDPNMYKPKGPQRI